MGRLYDRKSKVGLGEGGRECVGWFWKGDNNRMIVFDSVIFGIG